MCVFVCVPASVCPDNALRCSNRNAKDGKIGCVSVIWQIGLRFTFPCSGGPVDEGYAWVCVFACMCVTGFIMNVFTGSRKKAIT